MDNIYSIIKDAIFRINDQESGTAFLVQPNIALTVAHALGESKEIEIQHGDKKVIAKVNKYEDFDIAVLTLSENLSDSYLEIYDYKVEVEDKWQTFGYPNFSMEMGEFLEGHNNKVVGVCNIQDGDKFDIRLKYEDQHIRNFSGFSGSPLIIDGKLVGIINNQILQQGQPIRITALSVKYFKSILIKHGMKVIETTNSELALDFKKVNVFKIDLRVGFSSTKHITSLMFQPSVKLTGGDSKPYIISNKEEHFKKIQHLISLSTDSTKNGLAKDIKFILMPEYSINGISGVACILEGMKNSLVEEQVLIGGIDGLNKEEYLSLLSDSSFEYDLRNQMVKWVANQPDGKWFNSAIIIEKYKGDLRYYLQPKLLPSPSGEGLENMAEGKWILFFSTDNKESALHFFTLLCYDWIGVNEGEKNIEVLAQSILDNNYKIKQRENCIAFVPQYNPKPNHKEFISSIKEFLNNSIRWQHIHGRNALAFMINVARDEDSFGETSIIISNGCYNCEGQVLPTYSIVSRKDLESYTDIRFRDKRECIYAIESVLPFSIDDRSNSERYPCKQAIVHTIDGKVIEGDPRYPNPPSSVCGYKKSINDFIDRIEKSNLVKIELEGSVIESLYESILKKECSEYRLLNKNDVIRIFNNFFEFSNYKKYNENCDYWSFEIEGNVLENLIGILCLFKVAELNIESMSAYHGKLIISSMVYEILIIYIKESEEQEVIKVLRRFYIERLDHKMHNRMLILTVGKISSRLLNRVGSSNGRNLGLLTQNDDIFCKIEDLINDISQNIDKVNQISELRDIIQDKLGGRSSIHE